jgi:hypothetical protein
MANDVFSGMSPEQIFQARQLEQQDQSTILNMANALAGRRLLEQELGLQERRLEQQAEETKRAQKLQLLNTLVQKKHNQVVENLRKQRNELDAQRVKLQGRRVDLEEEKQSKELERLNKEIAQIDQKMAFTENLKTPITTNVGKVPAGLAIMYDNIKPLQPEKVGEFKNEKGDTKLLYTNPGAQPGENPFQIYTPEELKGFEKMPSKETEVKMGPREHSKESERGSQIAEIQGPEWLSKRREEFQETNFEAAGHLLAGKPTDPNQENYQQSLQRYQRAQQEFAKFAANKISDALPGNPPVIYIPEGNEHGMRPGFYRKTEKGEAEYVRSGL